MGNNQGASASADQALVPAGSNPQAVSTKGFDPSRCRKCDGVGWIADVGERCCGRAEQECGGRGCSGPEPEQVHVRCARCRGSGKVKEAPRG